jgi:diacylglycerol kinase family enzyme
VSVRTAVVVNPTNVPDAAETREREITAALSDLDCPPPIWLPTTPDDPGGGQTRTAIAAGVDVVIACGGDGTVRACADELADTRVALAVLPAGTGNLIAANLALPTDVVGVVAAAVHGQRRRIDLGCLDGNHFALMAGMGFDAAMMSATPQWWKRRVGWPAYVVGGLRRLFDRSFDVQITLDGAAPFARTARTVLVANLGRMQGGIDLFGDAKPDDGLLDIAVIAPRGPAGWLSLATTMVLRRTPPTRQVESFRASTVDVHSRTSQPRQVDGDPIAEGSQLTVTVRTQALLVCVP